MHWSAADNLKNSHQSAWCQRIYGNWPVQMHECCSQAGQVLNQTFTYGSLKVFQETIARACWISLKMHDSWRLLVPLIRVSFWIICLKSGHDHWENSSTGTVTPSRRHQHWLVALKPPKKSGPLKWNHNMYTNLGKNKKALWCFYSFFAQYPNFRMVNIHIDFCRLNPFWWLFRPSFSVPSCHKSYSATNWCLVPGAAEAWSTAVFEKHEKRPMERTTHQAFIVVLSWFYIVVVAIWNGDVLESCWFTRGRVSPMVSLKWSSKDFWWIFMMENPPRNGYLPFSLEPTNQWPWTMDLFDWRYLPCY